MNPKNLRSIIKEAVGDFKTIFEMNNMLLKYYEELESRDDPRLQEAAEHIFEAYQALSAYIENRE
jgi:hypothetical protein